MTAANRSQSGRYLTVEDVAARLNLSPWSVREKAKRGELPHHKLPGSRRLLFNPAELAKYENQDVELELIRLARGGRICRPVADAIGGRS